MKNLVVTQDRACLLAAALQLFPSAGAVVAAAHDHTLGESYFLCQGGVVLGLPQGTGAVSDLDACRKWDLNAAIEGGADEPDLTWFSISLVTETGAVVCLSRAGNIVSIPEEQGMSRKADEPEHEGAIDEGLLSAAWSPDRSVLLLLTKVGTLLAMSNTWEVVHEAAMEPMVPGSSSCLCWSGDGEYFTLSSTDAADNTTKIRYFSKDFEFNHIGRHVAEGSAGVIKGLGSALAICTNGTIVASPILKARKWQICLLERNGLSHGGFELSMPLAANGFQEWEISGLDWDLPSSLLAVSLRARHPTNPSVFMGAVQIYHRNNYYWYLKQEFFGKYLENLGFDSEQLGRIYLSFCENDIPAFRVVDMAWWVCSSTTSDSSVFVIDGKNVKMTPLGTITVPPPMYHATLSPPMTSACTHVSTWSLPSGRGNGVACLSSSGFVQIYTVGPMGNSLGNADSAKSVNLSEMLGAIRHDNDWKIEVIHFRSVTVVPKENSFEFSILVLGSFTAINEDFDCQANDNIILIIDGSVNPNDFSCSFTPKNFVSSKSTITGLALCPENTVVERSESGVARVSYPSGEIIAIGMKEAGLSDDFEQDEMAVVLYKISDMESTGNFEEIAAIASYTVPECCNFFVVLSSIDNEFLDNSDSSSSFRAPMTSTVVSLSQKQRLYCGEFFLSAGVSSFAVNTPLRSLQYVTGGTKPLLNFVSFAGLLSLDPMLAEDQPIIEIGDPRPVERGAKIIVSVPGSSKVVIQLPRGNLEAFEPRPLILMKIRSLLDSGKYYDAITLVRKQRVDMNLLIDHSPRQFLMNLKTLVEESLKVNPEYLSLLIAALDDSDITLSKYQPPNNYNFRASYLDSIPLLSSEKSSAPETVFDLDFSKICSDSFNEMQKNIIKGQVVLPNKANGAVLPSNLIVDGLTIPGDSNGCEPQDAFAAAGGKTNYICRWIRHFLREAQVNGSFSADSTLHPILCTLTRQNPARLSDAILLIKSVCAGKAASRVQSALKYLAFLVNNEKLFNTSFSECDFDMAKAIGRQGQMDPKEYIPLLERFESIGAGASCPSPMFYFMKYQIQQYLERSFAAIDCGVVFLASLVDTNESISVDSDSFCTSFHKLVKDADCYATVLPTLSFLSNKCKNQNKIIFTAYQMCLKSYADRCALKLEYNSAISAYLSLAVPAVNDAVRTAKSAGQWMYAIAIAASNSGRDSSVSAAKVAQEIVTSFKESLDQGEQSDAQLSASEDSEEFSYSRATEASRLSLEYCNDVESAVHILLLSKFWNDCIQVSIKHGRLDLLQEDIASSLRHDAKELIKLLNKNKTKLIDLNTELTNLWKDPELRLKEVSESDAALLAEMNGNDLVETPAVADNVSEYSAASRMSRLSYVSKASRASRSSQKSGMSYVSVLSTSSNTSTSSKASKTSSFAVEGLEHSLLSRGNADHSTGLPSKGGRRNRGGGERTRRMKGDGKDIFGLRREAAACEEFKNISTWFSRLVHARKTGVVSIIEALMIIQPGSRSDRELAASLQSAADAFALVLQEIKIPIAPKYTPKWLTSKSMTSVSEFQQIESAPVEPSSNDQKTEVPEPKPLPPKVLSILSESVNFWLTVRKLAIL